MSIRHWDVEFIAYMPDRDRFPGGLDVVSYSRTGGTVFLNFRQGPYSVAVTAEVTTVPSVDESPWFKAQCDFQVRLLNDLHSKWTGRGQIEGYGRSEDEAILAAVNLFLDRLELGSPGAGSRP
jgi:hypothetical protein